jgi:ClpP class serine protease
VSEGRKRTPAQLADVVEGRIMTGTRAREGGLVDKSGGLRAALERADKLGGVGKDTELEVWPGKQSIFDKLGHAFGGSDAKALAGQGLGVALSALDGSGLATLLVSGEHGPFAALPYSLVIR